MCASIKQRPEALAGRIARRVLADRNSQAQIRVAFANHQAVYQKWLKQ
jgi:hypothetical protein